MSNFYFTTTIGTGVMPVRCCISYETDETGSYNETIQNVISLDGGLDLASYLSDEMLNDLEMEGLKALETSRNDFWSE